MKFKILYNDGQSLKPFELDEIEAKDKKEAWDKLEEIHNFNINYWVLTEDEFKQLKEILK
jgi:hypothetical protein